MRNKKSLTVRDSFLDILMSSTPEEVNDYIAIKGKKKMVNAITFLDNENYKGETKDESKN